MSLKSEATETVSGESSVTAEMVTNGAGVGLETMDECSPCETSASSASICCEKPALSKSQIKKQKKKERWLQFKAEKRQAEKDKRKKRLAEMRERGEDIGPSRKSLKRNRMVDSACRQRVVIDCSFDEFMTEKDTTFLVQQIQHSYAANRRADNPLQLYICGIGGKAKQRLDSIGDYKGWDIHKEECDFTQVFPKEEVVYLSSESPNVLDTLDDSKVYVIGGLVDHNHHKGLCHRLAEERGMTHAQLPIGQFLQLKSRKVLTINHVFEILLRFTETRDWQKSLVAVLPQRKGVALKTDQDKTVVDHCRNSHSHDKGDTHSHDKGDTHSHDKGDTRSHDKGDTHSHDKDDKGDMRATEEDKAMITCVTSGSNKLSAVAGSSSDSAAVGVQVSMTGDAAVTDSGVLDKGDGVCSGVTSQTETSVDVSGSGGDVDREVSDAGDA